VFAPDFSFLFRNQYFTASVNSLIYWCTVTGWFSFDTRTARGWRGGRADLVLVVAALGGARRLQAAARCRPRRTPRAAAAFVFLLLDAAVLEPNFHLKSQNNANWLARFVIFFKHKNWSFWNFLWLKRTRTCFSERWRQVAISIRRSLDKYMLAENSLSNSKSWVLENAVRTLLLLTKSLTWSVFDELLAGDAGGLSFFETVTHIFLVI
jgi:hypothetical protein